jgi:hypothetical protein
VLRIYPSILIVVAVAYAIIFITPYRLQITGLKRARTFLASSNRLVDFGSNEEMRGREHETQTITLAHGTMVMVTGDIQLNLVYLLFGVNWFTGAEIRNNSLRLCCTRGIALFISRVYFPSPASTSDPSRSVNPSLRLRMEAM